MYDKTIGRLRVLVSSEGLKMHYYSHGAEISCPTGWNESCKIQIFRVSVEELRDLRYLLDRAIAAADGVMS
jgi:hypothetical protein